MLPEYDSVLRRETRRAVHLLFCHGVQLLEFAILPWFQLDSHFNLRRVKPPRACSSRVPWLVVFRDLMVRARQSSKSVASGTESESVRIELITRSWSTD